MRVKLTVTANLSSSQIIVGSQLMTFKTLEKLTKVQFRFVERILHHWTQKLMTHEDLLEKFSVQSRIEKISARRNGEKFYEILCNKMKLQHSDWRSQSFYNISWILIFLSLQALRLHRRRGDYNEKSWVSFFASAASFRESEGKSLMCSNSSRWRWRWRENCLRAECNWIEDVKVISWQWNFIRPSHLHRND